VARKARIRIPAVAALVFLTCGSAWAQVGSGRQAALALQKAMVETIARAEKSVVAIARVRRQRPNETFSPEFRPDPFGRRPLSPAAPQPTDPDFVPNEYGTGVVIDRRGLILTAYHVLGEDSDYYVTTAERKVYRAWIKGADPRSDLAVLAIDADNLVPINFADASGLKKGQIVMALGNPYAIARDGQASASWGIVSNLARKAPPVSGQPGSTGKPTLHHFGTLIQTDARLNLGTSGGPLLNLEGRMVGLNVALAAATGYERAAGYAIAVDETFRRAVETLKQGSEVEYGFMGIRPANLSVAEIHGGQHGVRAYRVVRGAPADRFGVKENDIITTVSGRPIYEIDDFVREVGRLPVEAVARLGIIRKGRPRELDVKLSKYPVRGKKIITNPVPAWRGMRVDYPTAVIDSDQLSRSIETFYGEGVIITDVAEDTPAWKAGLRRGMLVNAVDRTSVRTPRQFLAVVSGKSGSVQVHLLDDQTPLRTVPPGS